MIKEKDTGSELHQFMAGILKKFRSYLENMGLHG